MVVAVSVCELHLPASRSLKHKRRVIKSLVERLHRRYRISIAETEYHDLHQRAEISIAVVGNRESELVHLLQQLRQVIESEDEAMLTHWEPQFIEGRSA